MNYKQRDDELIRRQKELQAQAMAAQKVNTNTGYSLKALEKLASGGYKNRVPELKANKPSTRYSNTTAATTTPKQSSRDTTYDKDFDNFYNYRYGDFSGEVDYDPVKDMDVEKWRNVKKDIMAKNKWSEKEFDTRWEEYDKERSQKTADQEVQTAVDVAKKHPVLGTILQAAYTPQNMIEGAAAMLSNLAPEKYKAQSADDPRFTGTRAKEAIKQTVKDEHIKTGFGKGAYDLGTSVGDMALSSAIPVLGTASLGAQAAARTNMQALERGVDPNKAAATAGVAGLVSGVMNKVGLDKALGAGGKTALGAVGRAAATEGAENVAEDSVNLLTDALINQNQSQFGAMHDYYVSQGMSDKDAWNKVSLDTLGDLGMSALSGAAFGGVMSGVRNLPGLTAEIGSLANRMDNKGGVDVPSLLEEARKAMPAAAKVEGEMPEVSRNTPLEGADLDNAKTQFKDLSNQLKQKNKDIKAQEEAYRNAAKKNRNAEYKKLEALRQEAKDIQGQKKALDRQMKGIPTPIKEQLDEKAYNSIYDTKTGKVAHINYAVKFAGDTPEAKQLGKDVKQALNKWVESGNANDWGDLLRKANALDELAMQTNAEYNSKAGNKYNYRDYFGTITDELGEYDAGLVDFLNDKNMFRAVKDIHSANVASAPIEETTGDRALTPEEVQKLQDVVDGKYDIPENGNLPNSTKIPEYTMGEDVYFRGSDDDIVRAETQDKAIVDTFRNIINDPEFNALSFKNGNKEVFVSPATNGNGLRMSYTIDGVPTGHHDYSFDQIDELSRVLRNEAGNGGEDIKIQRKSDIAKQSPSNVPNVKPAEPIPPEPPRRSFFDEPPRSDKEGKSKVGTNTAVNSDVYTREQIENDPVISELNKYAKANNDLTFNKAKENIYKEGATLLDEYTSGRRAINSDLDVDQSMILLTDMANKINAGDKGLEAQRDLLFSRLRQAGTLYGQTIQAFKKWNNTAEGAIINGEGIISDTVKPWKSQNKNKVVLNGRIAKALEQMGVDSSMRNKPAAEKTHEQIKEGVKNVIAREFGSVEQYFNDNDLEFLTTLAEERSIPVWQITDEIEHKLATGEWYTLDESTQPKYPVNQKLKNALDDLIKQEPVEKEPLSLDEIRNQVKSTLDKEMAGTSDFTDNDVDYLANLIQNGATKSELTEALNTKMATGKFGISPETQQQVTDLFAYANRFDPDSKQAFDLRTAAYKLIAEEAVSDNATPFEKFESWRYLAMLGNPKTMVRNWVGNKMFGAVTGASNNLSAILEAGTDKLSKKLGGQGIQRTKAILNPADDRALIKAAANDGEAHRYTQLSGSKYEKGTKDAIKQQKSAFNSKLLRLYEAATDRGISDYSAVKKKYSTSLAGYMKANGLDESAFDADAKYRDLRDKSRSELLTDAERAEMNRLKDTYDTLEKARDYAVKQAEYATFHEDNKFAKWLTKTSNSAPGPLRMVIEGLVPFKKTPANILKSGAQYSPLGALDSIRKTGKLIYENTGSRKGNLDDTYTKKSKLTGKEKTVDKTLAADVLDSWSKTLTGSALVGLGYFLKNKGILNSSNKDEKWQDDLEGIQNYSITINGKTYTLDWAAPAVMPLLMGAEMSKIKDRNALLDEKWYQNLDDVIGTVNAIADPIFETSMLQGIKDTMQQAANDIKYNENGAIGGILGSMALNTGLGYATQGIPTLSGQITRTLDNTRRTTDTVNEGALGVLEKQGRKIMNKVPGLSRLNTEYRDAYGRTQQNSPFNNLLGNMAYQMLSPAYIRDINTTAADKSARDVYYSENEAGVPILDEKVFPAWKSTVKAGGQKLAPKEMATYRKASGEAQYAIRDALTKEDWFNNLDGEKQTEILKKVNTLVDKIGKDEVGVLDSSSKDLETYQSGGIPSLFDKWNGEQINKQITDVTGLSASTNAAKEIAQDIKDGNTAVAQQKMQEAAQQKQELDALNQKYGTEMTMSQYTKYGSKEAAEQHILNKQAAAEAGYVDKDGSVRTSDYEKAIAKAGAQAQKMQNDLPRLAEAGLPKSAYYTYANAINVIPSLQPAEFAKTFKEIDVDNSGGLKQAELKDYLNKYQFSSDPTEDARIATQIWDAYGGWTNKAGVKKKIKLTDKGWVDYY